MFRFVPSLGTNWEHDWGHVAGASIVGPHTISPLAWKNETELHERNEAFVALTRARVWCVATGIEGPIFEELRRAVEQQPELKFAAFTRRELQRIMDEWGDGAGVGDAPTPREPDLFDGDFANK